MEVTLRNLTKQDLEEYTFWKLPIHKYHDYNGPYFQKLSEAEARKKISALAHEIDQGNTNPLPQKKIISNSRKEILGEVSWYWKSKETNWLEVGIIIFNEANWGKGIGKNALSQWIDELFQTKKEIVRLGFSTWSGNEGMIKLAKHLGMQEEARYRKARIVDEKYYDSLSYGILREEWKEKD